MDLYAAGEAQDALLGGGTHGRSVADMCFVPIVRWHEPSSRRAGSSSSLNHLLRRSLPKVLGSGICGSYGIVPSLANVSDDPSRDEPIGQPHREPPAFLSDAMW